MKNNPLKPEICHYQATLRKFHKVTTSLSNDECPPLNAISLPCHQRNLYIPPKFGCLASHEVAQSWLPLDWLQDVIQGSRPKVPFGMVSYWGQRCSQPIPHGLRWIWDCSGHFRRKQVLDHDDVNGRTTLHLLCWLPWAWLEPLFPQRRR